MNKIENLEKKLESLVPRKASEQIRSRLFGTEPCATKTRNPFPLLACLMPAACCLMLLGAHFGILHPGIGKDLLFTGNSNELAGLSSNLLACYAGEAPEAQENLWREVTFEWTKGADSVSTTGYFPVGKTNLQKL